MSENNNTEDKNKDIKPVVEVAEKKSVEEVDAKVEQKPTSSGNSFSYVLILLLGVASAAGAYYFWDIQNKYKNDLVKQASQISTLKNELNKVSSKVEDGEQESQKKLAQYDQQIRLVSEELAETTKISQQAIEVVNRSQRDWAMAEVDYLLRVAHRRLEVSKDIAGSIAALKGADARLQQLGDLNLFEIRKQIAKDIAGLNSIKMADVSGIALALDQVLINLVNLPFKSVQEEVQAQLEEPVKEEINKEQTFVDSVIKTVKEIGDIKIHQRSIKVAKGEKQQVQIEQLMHTHLIGARLALLNKDQVHFKYELEQSIKLIENYYDQEDERVKRLSNDLASFVSVELNPQLPVLTVAWSMLQTEINKPVVENMQEPEK